MPALIERPAKPSTGRSACPATANAAGDGPAVRPEAFSSCTRYDSIRAGPVVSVAGSLSTASEAPAVTPTRVTALQGFVPMAFALVPVSRQISAVTSPLTGSLSVLWVGVVQCSRTSSPTRVAVSVVPDTICGRFSVGGSGGPGLAHPASAITAANTALPYKTKPARRTQCGLFRAICIQTEAIAFPALRSAEI